MSVMAIAAGDHDDATTVTTMKAIVHDRYGPPDALEQRDVDKPAVDDDQVLVRVHASSVNPVEWYGVTGPFFARLRRAACAGPKRPAVGADLAGRVEAVGKDVDGVPARATRCSAPALGAWAEYARAREARLVHKPATSRSRKRRPSRSRRSPHSRHFATTATSSPGRRS